MHAVLLRLQSRPNRMQEPEGFAANKQGCCDQARMQRSNAQTQVAAHASSRSQHCLANCWLVSFSGVQLPAQQSQRALLHPAAPTCCACCRVLRSMMRGHRARAGKGTEGGEEHRGGAQGDGGQPTCQGSCCVRVREPLHVSVSHSPQYPLPA
jgi:hypothetical protein